MTGSKPSLKCLIVLDSNLEIIMVFTSLIAGATIATSALAFIMALEMALTKLRGTWRATRS